MQAEEQVNIEQCFYQFKVINLNDMVYIKHESIILGAAEQR